MPLVAAKCTQCGANIEVNPSQDAGICPHCGTAYVTEKVIKNYITNNYTNIGSVNIDTLNVSMPDPVEQTVNSYRSYMKADALNQACNLILDALYKDSGNAVYNLLAALFCMKYKVEGNSYYTLESQRQFSFKQRRMAKDVMADYEKYINEFNFDNPAPIPEGLDYFLDTQPFSTYTIYGFDNVANKLSPAERQKYADLVQELENERQARFQTVSARKRAENLYNSAKQRFNSSNQSSKQTQEPQKLSWITIAVAAVIVAVVVIVMISIST